MANDSGQSGRIAQRTEVVNHGIPFVTNDTYPQAPWHGMLVYNTDVSQFQIFDASEDGWLDPYLGQFGAQTYVNPAPPAVGMQPGDLWIQTPGNVLHIWTGTEWADYSDPRIKNKNRTFVAPADSPPTADAVGDLWLVTDSGNLTRRWSGTAWVDYRLGANNLTGTLPDRLLIGTQVQQDAAQAIIAAANAGTSADAAIAQAAQAIEAAANLGTAVEDTREKAAAAILQAGQADTKASTALADAAAAIELANAAGAVTVDEDAPAEPKDGELWIVPSAGNKIFTWTGMEWSAVTGEVAPQSVTDLEIRDLSLTVKKMKTSTHMIY